VVAILCGDLALSRIRGGRSLGLKEAADTTRQLEKGSGQALVDLEGGNSASF
jgi:hypothetical protein